MKTPRINKYKTFPHVVALLGFRKLAICVSISTNHQPEYKYAPSYLLCLIASFLVTILVREQFRTLMLIIYQDTGNTLTSNISCQGGENVEQ